MRKNHRNGIDWNESSDNWIRRMKILTKNEKYFKDGRSIVYTPLLRHSILFLKEITWVIENVCFITLWGKSKKNVLMNYFEEGKSATANKDEVPQRPAVLLFLLVVKKCWRKVEKIMLGPRAQDCRNILKKMKGSIEERAGLNSSDSTRKEEQEKKREEREREKFVLSSLRHCSRQYTVYIGDEEIHPRVWALGSLDLSVLCWETDARGGKFEAKNGGGNIVEKREEQVKIFEEEERKCGLLDHLLSSQSPSLSLASTSELLNNWFTSSLSLPPSSEF